jgi:hypothetical protein
MGVNFPAVVRLEAEHELDGWHRGQAVVTDGAYQSLVRGDAQLCGIFKLQVHMSVKVW